jgi:DNA processing protein
MPLDEQLAAWLRLSLVPGLDSGKLRQLLAAYGDPQRIVDAGRAALTRHVPAPIAAAIGLEVPTETVEATSRWLDDPGNRLYSLADPEYPRQLLQITDPPPLLYVKGRGDLLNQPALAIVGSRNATAQGVANAESFRRNVERCRDLSS